jgi:hypothetical protein
VPRFPTSNTALRGVKVSNCKTEANNRKTNTKANGAVHAILPQILIANLDVGRMQHRILK